MPRTDMAKTRVWAAVLLSWCAFMVSLGEGYVHENEAYEKENNLEQEPINKKRDLSLTPDDTVEDYNTKLKKKLYREQPIEYMNDDGTPTAPTSATDHDETENKFPEFDSEILRTSEPNYDVRNDSTPKSEVETRDSTEEVTTDADADDDDVKATSMINPFETYKSSSRADILYDLAMRHEYDLKTNTYKERKNSIETRKKQYQQVLRSYREMEEDIHRENGNLDSEEYKRQKKELDSLERFLKIIPNDLQLPNRPSEAIMDMNRMKLLDYIARAAHAPEIRRPLPAPTIILYGFPPKRTSAMSVFMPDPEPPSCPKPEIIGTKYNLSALHMNDPPAAAVVRHRAPHAQRVVAAEGCCTLNITREPSVQH